MANDCAGLVWVQPAPLRAARQHAHRRGREPPRRGFRKRRSPEVAVRSPWPGVTATSPVQQLLSRCRLHAQARKGSPDQPVRVVLVVCRRNMAAAEEDCRSVAGLLVQQIEFADTRAFCGARCALGAYLRVAARDSVFLPPVDIVDVIPDGFNETSVVRAISCSPLEQMRPRDSSGDRKLEASAPGTECESEARQLELSHPMIGTARLRKSALTPRVPLLARALTQDPSDGAV